jgi:hypothetical protein
MAKKEPKYDTLTTDELSKLRDIEKKNGRITKIKK